MSKPKSKSKLKLKRSQSSKQIHAKTNSSLNKPRNDKYRKDLDEMKLKIERGKSKQYAMYSQKLSKKGFNSKLNISASQYNLKRSQERVQNLENYSQTKQSLQKNIKSN